MAGEVVLVGAGPGDPGLITIAGMRALQEADAVLYDALAHPALLRNARAGAELVNVGKRAGLHAMEQDAINRLLVAKALAGARVVRLKGGDPFVFGRGGEEALACREAGIPFRVVPGITSAVAAPAYAGIPVTNRGVAAGFTVITGNTREDGGDGPRVDWEAAARCGTLVILMGAASLGPNMRRLMDAGLAAGTPVACVQWGTLPRQREVHGTAADIAGRVAEAGLGAPMVAVVGEVARLAEDLAWWRPGPLAGRTVVVTRARTQASALATKLEALGAETVEAPVIEVRPRAEDLTTDGRVSSRWDWVLFSSANGVHAFFDALAAAGRDARSLSTTKVGAVGGATAEALRARGVIADFVPSVATGEALAAEVPRVHHARVLLPGSTLSGDDLRQALRARGALVEQVAVYETVPAPLTDEVREAVLGADAVTFASASSARNLRAALGGAALAPATKLVTIGPETSSAVRECFGRVDREAAAPGLDALVEAVREELAWD